MAKKTSGGTMKSAPAAKAKKAKKAAKWTNSSAAYEKKQQEKVKGASKKSGGGNVEDTLVGTKHSPSKRIRDLGQKPPKGYMRTGGRYFAKVANMRPIKSMTTMQQQALFYANKPKFLGVDGAGGYLRSASMLGMYNGDTSEANFRQTSGARKLIDADGGTYAPGYYTDDGKPLHAAGKKATKSRYIMAIGQDGHKR